MRHVGAFEATPHLSELLAAVEAGESLTITRRGKAVALLSPVQGKDQSRTDQIKAFRALRDRLNLDWTTEEILSACDAGRR
jgi:prevent-host-death family protein